VESTLSSAAPARLESRSVPVAAMINLEVIVSSRDAAGLFGAGGLAKACW
jgi:hypothetical protein